MAGAHGLQAVIDDEAGLLVADDTPAGERRYRARFHFDPNSITMALGNAHHIFLGYGPLLAVVGLELRRGVGKYQVRAELRDDPGDLPATPWLDLSDAPHVLELDWRAASAPGADDGGLTLWLDGQQQAELTGIDNDTRRVDRVRLGPAVGLDPGTRGTEYFDAFESRRDTYIGPEPPGAVTITYAYDPLQRLTAADYSPGAYFHYAYDATGNRQSETTPAGTTLYSYDAANRLTSVGGTTYAWDAKGNLLSDGVSTYTYDTTNRLTGVMQGTSANTFNYNGLGDRLRQTVNGTPTTYTSDLAVGLTQVLADGANTYLYGLGRIGEQLGAGGEGEGCDSSTMCGRGAPLTPNPSPLRGEGSQHPPSPRRGEGVGG